MRRKVVAISRKVLVGQLGGNSKMVWFLRSFQRYPSRLCSFHDHFQPKKGTNRNPCYVKFATLKLIDGLLNLNLSY